MPIGWDGTIYSLRATGNKWMVRTRVMNAIQANLIVNGLVLSQNPFDIGVATGVASNYGLALAGMAIQKSKLLFAGRVEEDSSNVMVFKTSAAGNITIPNADWTWAAATLNTPTYINSKAQIGVLAGVNNQTTSVFLRRDGTLPMTGDLNMGTRSIYNGLDITMSRDLLMGRNITGGGNLEINGVSFLKGDTTVGQIAAPVNMVVNGNSTVTGNSAIGGNETITGNLSVGGTGTFVGHVTMPDATITNVNRSNKKLTALLPVSVILATYTANNATIISKPVCDTDGIPQIYINPHVFISSDDLVDLAAAIGFNIYAENATATTWKVVMKDAYGQDLAADKGYAVVTVACSYQP